MKRSEFMSRVAGSAFAISTANAMTDEGPFAGTEEIKQKSNGQNRQQKHFDFYISDLFQLSLKFRPERTGMETHKCDQAGEKAKTENDKKVLRKDECANRDHQQRI